MNVFHRIGTQLLAIAWAIIVLNAGTLARAENSQSKSASPERVAGRTLSEWTAELSKSQNEIAQLRAVVTLGAFGEPAAGVLITALSDRNAAVRYWAASELGDQGVVRKTAIPALRKMMQEKFVGLRISAAYALCRFGDVKQGLPVLIEALKFPERGVANSAADFLARIGPPAEGAVDALTQATKHQDYHVRGAALEALRRIRSKPAS